MSDLPNNRDDRVELQARLEASMELGTRRKAIELLLDFAGWSIDWRTRLARPDDGTEFVIIQRPVGQPDQATEIVKVPIDLVKEQVRNWPQRPDVEPLVDDLVVNLHPDDPEFRTTAMRAFGLIEDEELEEGGNNG